LVNILMVAARYAPFVGGTETHVREVSVRMATLGHQVTVLTADPTGSLLPTETVDGITIKRVKARPRNRDWCFAPGIYAEIVRARPDVIHFQGYHTFVAPLGMMAAIRHRIPFVLTFHSGGHSSGLRNTIRGVQSAVLAPLVSQASHLIGVSEFEAETFGRRMGIARERFSVVPNGASLPPPSDPPPVVDPNLILSVGRLEHYKGHHRAIHAFSYLLRHIPDARMQIVGSGPYERQLRQIVNDCCLADRITFTSIPGDERQRLTDLLCSAALVILLSDYEAHPVAILEALSVQRPVLVTDTSGLRELAQRGFCRSVPLDATASTIAAAIALELAGEDRLRPTVMLPNWDNCTQELIGIYEDVVETAVLKVA
jgi:glycosyltransferase involved in cell wall biosynthesis